MTDGFINGVHVKGYTSAEDVKVQVAPNKWDFLGTRVTMPTGACIFLKGDKQTIEENQKRGAKIDFGGYNAINAANLYDACIDGVPDKKDFINLWDCQNVDVDVENVIGTNKKRPMDFDANGEPLSLLRDNDIVNVRYIQKGKNYSNSVSANIGDIVNKQTVEHNSFTHSSIYIQSSNTK